MSSDNKTPSFGWAGWLGFLLIQAVMWWAMIAAPTWTPLHNTLAFLVGLLMSMMLLISLGVMGASLCGTVWVATQSIEGMEKELDKVLEGIEKMVSEKSVGRTIRQGVQLLTYTIFCMWYGYVGVAILMWTATLTLQFTKRVLKFSVEQIRMMNEARALNDQAIDILRVWAMSHNPDIPDA